MDRDFFIKAKPPSVTTLNVLFLGKTDIGDTSIADLVAASVEQGSHKVGRRAPGGNVRSISLDGKKFALYASPTSESMSATAKESVQETMTLLRKNGGIHLVVYCVNAIQPIEWIHEVHRTINSDAALAHIPAVAAIIGTSDKAEQERWWSDTKNTTAEQGPLFDDHAFIQVTSASVRSLTKGRISEIRRSLHDLILKNVDSETNLNFQRAAFYKQRSLGNSLQSLRIMLARNPPSHISTSSKATEIVLLGEIGVGKSSLINQIAKAKIAEVSSDTIGCTRTVTKYTFEENGRVFHVYDTPGLVDPQMGDKLFVDPIDTIQRLIYTLGNGNGPDLLLFCIDNARPTMAFKRNCCIFYKFICGRKVPFALAVTKLDKSADQWWSECGATVRKYGIDRSRYIGLGREKRDPGANEKGRPNESLLSFFASCADRQKVSAATLLRVRSSMGRVASLLRSRASTPESILVEQCGLEERIARELVKRMVSSKNKSVDSYATR